MKLETNPLDNINPFEVQLKHDAKTLRDNQRSYVPIKQNFKEETD